ncbi:hypothetical protein BJ875DRAFT_368356 [Amylocarpus encephaloides]|uniref:Inosine/uridine-preferring nucleoside hydrolase domain-containing protein n=1 Tax=Amylocarpus encephaloides TaxID=45428 RepID=A0A9P8C8V5_9HELO|nr:hypothetical protein BJ875DRAFT_368356 [Amylocarpus encephaloides]
MILEEWIPKEVNGVRLTDQERKIYETLLKVAEARQGDVSLRPRVVVITDLAKDYDDLAAMVVLKELHRLGIIELLGFIANLEPASRRAQFGRGALDQLGLKSIRIAEGTSGFPDPEDGKPNRRHKVETYEFDCPFMAREEDPRLLKGGNSEERLMGQELLEELCESAQKTGQKLTLLLISSLEDIHKFSAVPRLSRKHKKLLRNSISNIVLQGGYQISPEGKVLPIDSANNNRYDPTAAREFHTRMQDAEINSTVYTKTAAIAATLDPEVFAQLAQTRNHVGEHLWKVQKSQDLAFYRNASELEPEKRFRADLDQANFLRTRTNWFDNHTTPPDKFPDGEEISNFTRVVVYDALAAVGVSGDDALAALGVLDLPPMDELLRERTEVRVAKERHKIVGVEGVSSGIHARRMVTVLSALLKGSLMSPPSLSEQPPPFSASFHGASIT